MKENEPTQAQFDKELELLVASMSASELLAVAGVYEVLAEALNNEVLERLGYDD